MHVLVPKPRFHFPSKATMPLETLRRLTSTSDCKNLENWVCFRLGIGIRETHHVDHVGFVGVIVRSMGRTV